MHKLCILLVLIGLSHQCETPHATVGAANCGVNDPAKELVWLKDIIAKAEADRTNRTYSGNYIGAIYLETFNDRDVFHTNMAMGSGGLAMRVYYCDGQPVSFATNDQLLDFVHSLRKTRLIYTNMP